MISTPPRSCQIIAMWPCALIPDPLEEILQSWKGFTSLKINERLQTDGRFWQPESYDRIIRGEEHFRKVVRYILRNPGMANLGDSGYWMHFGGREWGTPERAK